jgi:hypothetical protein
MDSVVGAIVTMTSAAGIAVPLSVVTRPVIVWTRPWARRTAGVATSRRSERRDGGVIGGSRSRIYYC